MKNNENREPPARSLDVKCPDLPQDKLESTLRSKVARKLPAAFQRLLLNRLFYFLNRKRKRILTYHNVIPDRQFRDIPAEGVSHRVSVFKQQIEHLSARFPIGLNLEDPRELILTFDDGYWNQYEFVHVILKEYGIRGYFFFTLDLLSGDHPLLIDQLLFWLSYVDRGTYQVRVEGRLIQLQIETDQDRHRCWQKLYPIIRPNFKSLAPSLLAEFESCYPSEILVHKVDQDYYRQRFTAVLPDALNEMKSYGHMIGAHGKTHAPLAALDRAELEEEMVSCRQAIGVTFNCTAFSFPFGGVEESCQGVSNFGFSQIFGNINCPLPASWEYSNSFIPRMSLPNEANAAELDFILSGAKYFLTNFKLLPKW